MKLVQVPEDFAGTPFPCFAEAPDESNPLETITTRQELIELFKQRDVPVTSFSSMDEILEVLKTACP